MSGAEVSRPLGVVIPTYNEGEWVRRAVAALLDAAEETHWQLDVVVVNDGGEDLASRYVLDGLDDLPEVRVMTQPNQGRFSARATGLRAVKTEYVLLLDSRVEIDRRALARIANELLDTSADVWNFDVTPGSSDPRALFWTGITKLWWREYFVDRRRVSFGTADFDRFPKGTTAFFAPRQLLLDALDSFSSLYEDPALASDDTRLLREVARRQRINLSPQITCRHFVKTGWRPWLRQCYYRGTTFVDGYLEDPERARPLLVVGVTAGAIGAGVAVRWPRFALAATLAGTLTAGAVVRRCGGTGPEAGSVVTLAPLFGPVFGAGVLRGLWHAGRRR